MSEALIKHFSTIIGIILGLVAVAKIFSSKNIVTEKKLQEFEKRKDSEYQRDLADSKGYRAEMVRSNIAIGDKLDKLSGNISLQISHIEKELVKYHQQMNGIKDMFDARLESIKDMSDARLESIKKTTDDRLDVTEKNFEKFQTEVKGFMTYIQKNAGAFIDPK
jgi:DNA anti-recombination protein RmuC